MFGRPNGTIFVRANRSLRKGTYPDGSGGTLLSLIAAIISAGVTPIVSRVPRSHRLYAFSNPPDSPGGGGDLPTASHKLTMFVICCAVKTPPKTIFDMAGASLALLPPSWNMSRTANIWSRRTNAGSRSPEANRKVSAAITLSPHNFHTPSSPAFTPATRKG